MTIPSKKPSITRMSELEAEFAKDTWSPDKVGMKIPPYIRINSFSFKRIEPPWLREITKRYVRHHIGQRAYFTLSQYRCSAQHFSHFLNTLDHPVGPRDINRALMLQFTNYIHQSKSGADVKNRRMTNIKQITEMAAYQKWAPITTEKLLSTRDRLRFPRCKPRYIPTFVLDQLNKHIGKLPEEYHRIIMILQHTGRRIGELCALPLDCLLQDNEGDYCLRYMDFKLSIEHTIPLTRAIAELILEQQSWVKKQYDQPRYLFTAKDKGAMRYYSVSHVLNNLGLSCNIRGSDGIFWRFQLHQFRHTVGTQMINSGVPVHIVQNYLKHASPEMTMSYAHLHDKTLKAEFAKFQGRLVDISGKIINEQEHQSDTIPSDLLWLKRNILAQTLPNGYCGMPVTQGSCPHANACLTCTNFKTDGQFLKQHHQQLQETRRLIKIAEENSWTRQVEANKKVEANLSTIINTLEGK